MKDKKWYTCKESQDRVLLVDEFTDKVLFTVQDLEFEDEPYMFLCKEDVRSLVARLELWLNER